MNDPDPFRPEGAGRLIGVSGWMVLPQEMLTQFEELTLSNDPLHTDPDWVRAHTHYETTIAPGFLTLSLLPYLAQQVDLAPEGTHGVNYGFEQIRWTAPIPVGSDIRARFYEGGQPERVSSRGRIVRFPVVIEIRGNPRPGMIAEWLAALIPDASQQKT